MRIREDRPCTGEILLFVCIFLPAVVYSVQFVEEGHI